MTNDPRQHKDDNALEKDIALIRPAWERQANEEPPAMLDQAVMNRAKRELGEQGEPSRRRSSIRWLGAFATAAVVVLALTVVIEQGSRAPVPSAKEADGLRLDSDARPGNRSRARPEARPQQLETEPVADQPLKKQILREDFAAPAAAPAVDENDTGVLAAEQESAAGIPGAEAWIEQLLDLKKTGQREKLARELARFRSAYPDFPLPPELDE